MEALEPKEAVGPMHGYSPITRLKRYRLTRRVKGKRKKNGTGSRARPGAFNVPNGCLQN
jgi:hypothetical protein